jgi:hypothetical protein
MNNTVLLATGYTDKTILSNSVVSFEQLLADYGQLLQRLHGTSCTVSEHELRGILKDPHELLAFVVAANQVVATAQATLLKTPPSWQVIVNNVVTAQAFAGRGFGRRVLCTLEQAVAIRWGESGSRRLKLMLSNSPKKANGGFYQALGWTARSPESDNPTVVWVKQLG